MTLLADVVRASAAVAATSSRLAKTKVIADCLRALAPDEVEIALPFSAGTSARASSRSAMRACKSAMGHPAALSQPHGGGRRRRFQALKTVKGKGAASARADAARSDLFGKATAEEQDFLLRLIVGELRQGALEGVMLEARRRRDRLAGGGDTPRRHASPAASRGGARRAGWREGRSSSSPSSLMQPVLPDACAARRRTSRLRSRTSARALLEWKLDGARVQVHKSGDDIRVFTRNLNDVTARGARSGRRGEGRSDADLILDGEAIALRAGRPAASRSRSRCGASAASWMWRRLRSELPLSVFFFDCLLRDGEPLVDLGAGERHDILREVLAGMR